MSRSAPRQTTFKYGPDAGQDTACAGFLVPEVDGVSGFLLALARARSGGRAYLPEQQCSALAQGRGLVRASRQRRPTDTAWTVHGFAQDRESISPSRTAGPELPRSRRRRFGSTAPDARPTRFTPFKVSTPVGCNTRFRGLTSRIGETGQFAGQEMLPQPPSTSPYRIGFGVERIIQLVHRIWAATFTWWLPKARADQAVCTRSVGGHADRSILYGFGAMATLGDSTNCAEWQQPSPAFNFPEGTDCFWDHRRLSAYW